MTLEYATPEWEKAQTSEKVLYLRKHYGWPNHKNAPCFGTLEDIIFAEIYREINRLEVQFKQTKELWENACHKEELMEIKINKAQEMIAREWDSPTCIVDSEKIEEYNHCTCAEDYANVFVKRLKKTLGIGESEFKQKEDSV